MEAEIQKLTDESIKKIEQLTAAKNKDLTTL
jgi:ribosome recycling factor